ncbi:unnamed protein product [Protopolystoma xenopodis]|uniref:Uncharacterized protein n=1 Tax=Protopolystoma xenopodis TaxID=117903 RepID=A0A3S5BCD3_9PLAT|nr:unnamed protein product [Protopolystoma xenopodis]
MIFSLRFLKYPGFILYIDSELPPAYEPSPITFYPQTDFKTPYPTVSSSGKPPSLLTASSLPPPLPTTDPVAPPDFVLPILPSVPTSSTNNMGGQGGVSGMTSSSSSHQDESDELRFDDLSRRFQQLKGKK